MQVAVSVSGFFPQVLDDARWAEQVGLAGFAVPDHVLRAHAADPRLAATAPAPDPFVQLAALAGQTERIELATLCSPVTFRHPATLLKSATELSIVSEGRFTLGVGTGYRRIEHDIFGIPFPDTARRYELLEDTLGYLTAGRAQPNPGFSGRHFRLAAHPVAPAPVNLRLLVGGGGARRTPALAGRFADEYNLFVADVAAMRERIGVALAAFAAAGRPGTLALSCAGVLVTGSTRSDVEAEAQRQARIVGIDPAEYLAMHQAQGSFVGTHLEVARRLKALAALGIRRCYFVFEAPIDRAGVLAVRDALAATAEDAEEVPAESSPPAPTRTTTPNPDESPDPAESPAERR